MINNSMKLVEYSVIFSIKIKLTSGARLRRRRRVPRRVVLGSKHRVREEPDAAVGQRPCVDVTLIIRDVCERWDTPRHLGLHLPPRRRVQRGHLSRTVEDGIPCTAERVIPRSFIPYVDVVRLWNSVVHLAPPHARLTLPDARRTSIVAPNNNNH